VAKKKSTPSKSEHIRRLLTTNPKMKATEVVKTLAEAGIQVKAGLVYLIKGAMKGKKNQQAKARKMIAKATSSSGASTDSDAVALILQVKSLATQVGGMVKLKALVDALSE
jgi:predicted house-cleaning NTP pyrophosphatase (Maf/HAM1 superfamily)